VEDKNNTRETTFFVTNLKGKPPAQALLFGSVPWNSRKESHKRQRTLQRCHRHIIYIYIYIYIYILHLLGIRSTLSPFSLAMHLFPSSVCTFSCLHISTIPCLLSQVCLYSSFCLWSKKAMILQDFVIYKI